MYQQIRVISASCDEEVQKSNLLLQDSGGIKMSVAVAEGASCLPECVEDDDESSVLLDLSAMFPSLDHEVIVTVLQAHEGRVEAVVDYLMRIVAGGGEEEEEVEEELQGPFNDDIGGPPEIVPSFLQEDDHRSLTESPDPLPTYEQSCMPIEPGPPPYFSTQPSGSLPTSFTPVECNCTQQHSSEQHPPGNERGGQWETDNREHHSRESERGGQWETDNREHHSRESERGGQWETDNREHYSRESERGGQWETDNREHHSRESERGGQWETDNREHHSRESERGGQWETDNREHYSRESERGQQEMKDGSGPERVAQGETQTRPQAEEGSTPGSAEPWQHKPAKGRRSKLRKLAHKIGHRRGSGYKAEQDSRTGHPQLPYLRLLDDDELEDDSGLP